MPDALQAVAAAAGERFGPDLLAADVQRGELTLRVGSDHLLDLLAWLKDESRPSFPLLNDISGVDGLRLGWQPRFRVSYHLLSLDSGERVRVQADTAEQGGEPCLPTVTALWESANWNEREVWDLMGIRFTGHPDLRRILLHEDYDRGHPLQKQVPTRGTGDDNR